MKYKFILFSPWLLKSPDTEVSKDKRQIDEGNIGAVLVLIGFEKGCLGLSMVLHGF